ncbi:MAG: sodium:solute symporter family protein [Myxococcales bacterium]|nr:sodium:solute symporter family protein [Myxococcales bacterium]
MEQRAALLDSGGYGVVALYFVLLFGVGIAGRLARREDSLADFYLGGRALGPLVLFLTLYATQYSGLTLVGFAGNAYRQGYAFLVAVTFGCSIMGGYLMIAPRLHALSKTHGFVTPGDFLQQRYGDRTLTLCATAIFVFALASYILSNLKAIGFVVSAATGGRVGFTEGIVLLAFLMVLYETLGGMRAVAWTDVIQGSILLVSCILIFAAVLHHHGGLAQHAALLAEQAPQKWQAPDLRGKLGWSSTLLLVSFGVSIYPHAVQRIYAARDALALRRSLSLMLLMPFVTTLLMILLGILGAARFPGLSRGESEQIVLHVLLDLVTARPEFSLLVVVLVCATVAAIMSTVDSALLSIASLVTQDLYALLRPDAGQKQLTAFGKRFSWALMALLVYLAVALPQTLWRLTEVKLEVLCQAAPAVFLGLHRPEVPARAVLLGMGAGLGLTLVLLLGDLLGLPVVAKPLGVHAGVWGVALNGALTLALSRGASRLLQRAA